MVRDFKGIWIPKEIWLNSNLTMLDKVILVEIDSLDNEEGCTASNEYLCEFCQCSQQKLSMSISKLKELGLLDVVSFDGRKRVIKSHMTEMVGSLLKNSRQTSKKAYADYQKIVPINIDNNIDEYKEKEKDKSFSKKAKNSLDLSAVGDNMVDAVNTWLAYKREKGKSYKQIGFNAFYKKLVQLSGNNSVNAMKIIEQSMANNYDGIFPISKGRGSDNMAVGKILRENDLDKFNKVVEDGTW